MNHKISDYLVGYDADVFIKTRNFLLTRPKDDEIFKPFFQNVLMPEFEEAYGVKLKYYKNVDVMIRKLDTILPTLKAKTPK